MNGKRVLVTTIVLFGLIQLIPYGHRHTNPPVSAEPDWDSPRTRELFFRACKDCHSNQTKWPWYSHVAPASWLIERDVEEARSHFNVSEWRRRKQHSDEAAEKFRDKDMPPWFYLPLHAEARFSDAERADFLAGLIRMFGDEDAEEGD